VGLGAGEGGGRGMGKEKVEKSWVEGRETRPGGRATPTARAHGGVGGLTPAA